MENKEQKVQKTVDNSAFNDRFKFIFSVNDNIICERFFKINGFDYDAINSERMKDLFVGHDGLQYGDVITMIVNDLKSKSRVYTWYTTDGPLKLKGFSDVDETVYVDYSSVCTREEPKSDSDDVEPEIVNPYDVTFRFSFQMAQKSSVNRDGKPVFSDYRPVYDVIWDGSVYPKFVRNSVDLTNSYGHREGLDLSLMNFVQSLTYRMTSDKKDLVYHIIREICDAAVCDYDTVIPSQKKTRNISYLTYGDKEYPMSDFNKEYIDGWRKAVEQKTKDYFRGRN